VYKVDPWYPQKGGSKETTSKEKPQIHRMHRFQYCIVDA
jgi:hypothetical protein